MTRKRSAIEMLVDFYSWCNPLDGGHMISSKEQLIEYCLERFATLEQELDEAVQQKRHIPVHQIIGGMTELDALYRHLTKKVDLNHRLIEILKKVPT